MPIPQVYIFLYIPIYTVWEKYCDILIKIK